ncbi:hypothetical protein [Chryseobacterium sp.]
MLYYRLNYGNNIHGILAKDYYQALIKLCLECGKDIPEKDVRISSVIKIQ